MSIAILSACAARGPQPPAAPAPAPMDVTFLPCEGDVLSADGERIGLGRIVELAADADYVLIGEAHTYACDHAVQAAVIEALAQGERPPAIGFEMVATDRIQEMERFMSGELHVEDLPAALGWEEGWGYDFELYRPVFELAERHSLPVAPLNVPFDVVRKIAREGLEALTPDERGYLPSAILPPAAEQEAELLEIMAQHDQRDTGDAVQRERFVLVQSLWDSQMAEQAVRLRRRFDWPVVVLAGEMHVHAGQGIASRIEHFDPGARILVVSPWRGVERIDPDAANVFFYCPETYASRMGMVLEARRAGVTIVEVARGGRADGLGLRPGDVLVQAQGIELHGLFDLHRAGTSAHEADAPLWFLVRRGGETFRVEVGRLGQGTEPAAE